jgi:3-oxoacyl-[acyl-carrier protein] reductase
MTSQAQNSLFCNLNGLKAMVTGSSSGIGKAIALELSSAGAVVGLHTRQAVNAMEQIRNELVARGAESHSFQADLRNIDATLSFSAQAWDTLGGIDIWVNNAGVDLLTTDEAKLPAVNKLDLLHAVDVRATYALSREVAGRMRARGRGCIINIGWDQADRGMEGESGELFASAKNAVMGFTRSLAVTFAPEVRFNCVAPGWIKTAWGETASPAWQERVMRETPLKRWGLPEDIARTIRFLASPEASFITGQVINVNGGAVR